MAKTQKYSEDQLLEAVVKFSEVEKKKIKATELAEWCRKNVEGLEEVRDYHFTRSIRERDEKTGKIVERQKLCTLRMEEINKSRSLTVSINTNVLLRASSIDTFMGLPVSAQRQMIAETRETVDKLLIKNANLSRENDALKAENRSLKVQVDSVSDKIDALQKSQSKLIKQVSYLMKSADEAMRKQVLAEMGVEDGSIDLDTYTKSLQVELSKAMNINKSLREYVADSGTATCKEENPKNSGSIVDEVMSGLNL